VVITPGLKFFSQILGITLALGLHLPAIGSTSTQSLFSPVTDCIHRLAGAYWKQKLENRSRRLEPIVGRLVPQDIAMTHARLGKDRLTQAEAYWDLLGSYKVFARNGLPVRARNAWVPRPLFTQRRLKGNPYTLMGRVFDYVEKDGVRFFLTPEAEFGTSAAYFLDDTINFTWTALLPFRWISTLAHEYGHHLLNVANLQIPHIEWSDGILYCADGKYVESLEEIFTGAIESGIFGKALKRLSEQPLSEAELSSWSELALSSVSLWRTRTRTLQIYLTLLQQWGKFALIEGDFESAMKLFPSLSQRFPEKTTRRDLVWNIDEHDGIQFVFPTYRGGSSDQIMKEYDERIRLCGFALDIADKITLAIEELSVDSSPASFSKLASMLQRPLDVLLSLHLHERQQLIKSKLDGFWAAADQREELLDELREYHKIRGLLDTLRRGTDLSPSEP